MLLRSIARRLVYECCRFAGVFPYYGTRVYFPKGCHLYNEVIRQNGFYERDNVNILVSMAQKESVVFDVGANIGLIAVPLLWRRPDCTVVSFEPSPNNSRYLKRTAEKSGFGDRWRIILKAAGSKTGEMDFFTASPGMGAFDGFRDTQRAGKTKKISVPVTTLDSEWQAMGRPKVSVVKIDVEGAEIEVLKGAGSCIERERPYVFTEWNEQNFSAYQYEPKELFLWAEKNDYAIYSAPNLIPVATLSELKLQMIVTENFLLVPKEKK